MKKLFRRIGAILMAAVMVLCVCATVLAEDHPTGAKPTANDKGSITVSGVQAGDMVTAYKIVQAKYNDYGFIKYEPVIAGTITDPTEPTAAEIAALLNNASLTRAAQGAVAENATSISFPNLTIGTYLVKVEAGQGNLTVYNPMIASVFYATSDNQTVIRDGAISADDNWFIKGETAYAKSSKNTTPDKNIVDEKGEIIVNGQAAGKGDAVAKGDTVFYEISGMIPSYDPHYYTEPEYKIIDTLSSGLDLPDNAQQKLQEAVDKEFGEGNATVTVTGRKIEIDFQSSYIASLAGKTEDERAFSFTYEAVLNGTSVNFDASTNTVKVTYSKNPEEEEDSEPVTTYNYTFAFNGEVLKVDDSNKPLENAKFELFTDAECKTPAVYADDAKETPITEHSDLNGKLNFTGLDNKVYYMKEVETPSAEYRINDTVYKIEFEPTFATGGKMESYKVNITDVTNNGTMITTEYKYDGKQAIVVGNPTVVKIKNTKLGELPSTGGAGTYFFTALGVMVMAAVTGMFLVSRAGDRKADR